MDRNHNILPGTVGPAGVVMKNPDTGYNAHNDDDWPDNVTDKMAAVMEARPRAGGANALKRDNSGVPRVAKQYTGWLVTFLMRGGRALPYHDIRSLANWLKDQPDAVLRQHVVTALGLDETTKKGKKFRYQCMSALNCLREAADEL